VAENDDARPDDAAHQRWADDGGGPRAKQAVPRRTAPPTSWGTIGVALAVGFAVGWLTGE
jgi:hypothetical protein